MTEPLDPERERKIRRNYADSDPDGTVGVLLAEIDRLRAAMAQIQRLHTDSPMGPCPVCIDGDAVAAGGDGLMPYPCPTARLAGATDCEPPHVRAARYAAAGNEMAASLVRDGFGDDEIAEILNRLSDEREAGR